MTITDDREDGKSFSDWLLLHETHPNEIIWVFYDSKTIDPVGTASFVEQDRELLAPIDGLVIGGVNVLRKLRGKGIGTGIMNWLERQIYQIVCEKNHPIQVLLKADNPIAIHLYQNFGFTIVPGRDHVYEKVYYPGNRR